MTKIEIILSAEQFASHSTSQQQIIQYHIHTTPARRLHIFVVSPASVKRGREQHVFLTEQPVISNIDYLLKNPPLTWKPISDYQNPELPSKHSVSDEESGNATG